MELEREMTTFCRELPSLLADHEGEYVLIHGDRVDSFWKTEDEAYEAGCERFGLAAFLVRQVVREEQPAIFITHAVHPCPPSSGPSNNG